MLNVLVLDRKLRVQKQDLLTMRVIFETVKHIFALAIGLMTSMVNTSKVKFVSGASHLLTIGMVHAKVNLNET